MRLTVNARDGLVVVVPRGWRGDPALIVESHRPWAEAALRRVADRRALHLAGPEALLPHEIALPALGEVWRVEYRAGEGRVVRAVSRGASLVVSGDVDDASACLRALTAWLHRTAREHLTGRLAELADLHGLAYSGVRVAAQRSRWGSCSARGTISLNRNLLFLEPGLVDALLLHELAHTRHLDHSQRFWSALLELDPEAHAHRQALRSATASVPAWAGA